MDVFAFEDFSALFAAYVQEQKQRTAKFSFQLLSRRLGTLSAAMLHKIASGARAPSDTAFEHLCAAMELTGGEKQYAGLLVRRHRSNSKAETAYINAELAAVRRQHQSFKLECDSHDAMGRWYFPALTTLTALNDFKIDPEWIAGRMVGAITPEKISDALETLKRAGLLQQRSEQLVQVHQHVDMGVLTVDSEKARKAAFQTHRDFLNLALESLEGFSRTQRFIAGTTVAVKRSRIPELFKALESFRCKVSAEYDDAPADDVFYVALQGIPLTKPDTAPCSA